LFNEIGPRSTNTLQALGYVGSHASEARRKSPVHTGDYSRLTWSSDIFSNLIITGYS